MEKYEEFDDDTEVLEGESPQEVEPIVEPIMKAPEENELEKLTKDLDERIKVLEEKINVIHNNLRVHHKSLLSLNENFKLLLETKE